MVLISAEVGQKISCNGFSRDMWAENNGTWPMQFFCYKMSNFKCRQFRPGAFAIFFDSCSPTNKKTLAFEFDKFS